MTIRYGVIGTGMMGCEHIRNLAAMDDVEIVAVADPNKEPREWAIKSCGDRFSPRVHEDYNEILGADDVDALKDAAADAAEDDVDALDEALDDLDDALSDLGGDVSAENVGGLQSAVQGVSTAAQAVYGTLGDCP